MLNPPNDKALKSKALPADLEVVESKRNDLILEVLEKLENVTTQLDEVTKERDRQVLVLNADLETEREARRNLQNKATSLRQNLAEMDRGRFVLVLIDADADIYQFGSNDFLARGAAGGQSAAEQIVAKVREYLASLNSFQNADTVGIVVKAYANLRGMARSCVRDEKVVDAITIGDFWYGFSQRFPLVDFIDVGPGKEEADNKLKGVLSHYISNPQCLHLLLACCNDSGYVPTLREFASPGHPSERITLITSGPLLRDIGNLGLQHTTIFKPLFLPEAQAKPVKSYAEISATLASLKTMLKNPPMLKTLEISVKNSDNLGPMLYDGSGKRTDRPLVVHPDLVKEVKKQNLCSWHYLRGDCVRSKKGLCNRNHDYKRPLSSKQFEAQWYIARTGTCHTWMKTKTCDDEKCFYGHRID